MMYGLTEENIASINEVFAQEPDIHRVIIFGPRTTGKFGKKTDIHMALAGLNLAADELPDLEDTLGEIGLKLKFDLLLLNSITDPDLLAYIQTTGKGFYKKA